MRLDFDSFVLTGPSTSSATVGAAVNGQLVKRNDMIGQVPASAASVTQQSQCLTDVFNVVSPGNGNPPTLCGNLNNEHRNLFDLYFKKYHINN